jgi:heme-degrading monooxygenase HmoA
MTFVSITRLRIRSLRFMPQFLINTIWTGMQTRRADGFLDGSLLADRKRTFWTATLWRDQAAMRAYMTSGAHLKAMPKLLVWCDEASVVHWTQDDAIAPDWLEADRRMRTEGRPSKVLNPSPNHRDLAYDAPRTSGAVPINPVKVA